MWKEQKDRNLADCITTCQVAEDVITSMQDMLGNALAEYKFDKFQWCIYYMDLLRKVTMRKYDEVSAHILEYIEEHIYFTKEEKERNQKMQHRGNRGDSDIKPEFFLQQKTKDLKFGIYCNVQGKATIYSAREFEDLKLACKLPRTYGNKPVIMRVLWTAYNYVKCPGYNPDITVVSHFFFNRTGWSPGYQVLRVSGASKGHAKMESSQGSVHRGDPALLAIPGSPKPDEC